IPARTDGATPCSARSFRAWTSSTRSPRCRPAAPACTRTCRATRSSSSRSRWAGTRRKAPGEVTRSLFISDLHLSGERPETSDQFFRFIDEEARRAGALYILGDLFEYWVGDDELTGRDGDPLAAEVVRALRKLSDDGVKVSLMHGNRDFLLNSGFCT